MKWLVVVLLLTAPAWTSERMQPLTVHTTPPAATVRDITPIYLGLQRVWSADGMGYPLEASTGHSLRVSMDGFSPQDVDVLPGQSDLTLTLQPTTLASFVSFVLHYRQGPLAVGVALLGLAVAVPWVLHRRRVQTMSDQLMAAELDTRDLVGRVIDDFQVVEQIGEGAFATVYKVENVKHRDTFAMKLLKNDMLDTEIVTRFHREMTTGRDLRHPSMVPVYGFGHYHHRPYIVMELLKGRTLAERLLNMDPMPVHQTLMLFRQLAEGLAYAHERNIVHRDLKPDNVMLLADGSLRIMDFGIAKYASQAKLTDTGAFLGTPGYMSPEHLNSQSIDARADIYSAGVILYEMLAGRAPFEDKAAIDIMFHHAQTLPPPLHQFVPQLPAELAAVVMRMLEKDRNLRFQSMREVLDALQPFEAVRPVIPPGYRVMDGSRVEDEAGQKLVLRQIPANVDVDSENRRLSWLRFPGLDVPHTLFRYEESNWAVSDDFQAEPLGSDLSELQAVRWVSDLCDVYHHLHTAHATPMVLGTLSWANLRSLSNGHPLLTGFEYNDEGVLCLSKHEAGWSPPDADGSVQVDVYCLGLLLQRLTGPRGAKIRRLRDDLWQVLARATHKDPARRQASVCLLRSELDRIAQSLSILEAEVVPPVRRVWPRPRVVARLLVGILATGLLSAGAGWGAWGLRQAMSQQAPTWQPGSPDGSVVRMQGRVSASPDAHLLRAPLSGLSCVGYSAQVHRWTSQEVLDPTDATYRSRTQRQTLLDQARWTSFELTTEAGSVHVVPTAAVLQAPTQSFAQIPAGVLATPGLDTTGVPAPLPAGQHVLSSEGTERRVVPGQTVSLCGVVTHAGGQPLLYAQEIATDRWTGPVWLTPLLTLAGTGLGLIGVVRNLFR